MISFKQFIREDAAVATDFHQFIELAKKDCQPFLKAIDNKIIKYQMWRGSPDFVSKGVFKKLNVRKDRIPLDTQKEVHDAMDKWFDEKYGIKFRSQALFATGSKKMATTFGDTFLVFPIGKFDYCWSKEYPDLTEYVGMYFEPMVKKESNRVAAITRLIKNDPHVLDDFMKDGDWQFNEGLKDALYENTKHELMISCDSYYLVNDDAVTPRDWDDFSEALKG